MKTESVVSKSSSVPSSEPRKTSPFPFPIQNNKGIDFTTRSVKQMEAAGQNLFDLRKSG